MITAETLREAAGILRAALDPEQTPHSKYESLMLDIDWPAFLAGALEAEARVVDAGNPEPICAVWAKLGVIHGR